MKKSLLILLLIAMMAVVLYVMLGIILQSDWYHAWFYRPRAASDPLVIEPEEVIKETVLEITPVGMSMEDVLQVIYGQEKWEIYSINYERGFSLQGPRPDHYNFPNEYASDKWPVIGEKFIRANIGNYMRGFYTDVYVYWAFDNDEKLIDLYVRKDVDAL